MQPKLISLLSSPLQVQVDSPPSDLANRTVDLCQVQIWPSTFTVWGHPEPHAGSRLGGKASTDVKSCVGKLLIMTGAPALPENTGFVVTEMGC